MDNHIRIKTIEVVSGVPGIVERSYKMDGKRLGGAQLHLKITRLPDVSNPSTLVRNQPMMVDDVEPSKATLA
jgi:hypothetical protein